MKNELEMKWKKNSHKISKIRIDNERTKNVIYGCKAKFGKIGAGRERVER